MADVEHLHLVQRKALSVHLLHVDALLSLESDFIAAGAQKEFDHLSSQAHFLLGQEKNDLEDNNLNLDAFLQKFSARMEAAATLALERHHPALLKRALPVLQKNASSISCQACSPIDSTVCNGGHQDHQIVHQSGHCINALRQMFAEARDAAIAYYSKYAAISPADSPEIIFSTRRHRKKPHQFPVDYFVGGTTYLDETGARRSRIVLDIDIDRFDASTYLAVPYVLFHECICHAFQSLLPEVAKRTSTPEDDRFAEGWMDWVSYKILDEVLTVTPSQGSLKSSLLFSEEMRDTATAFNLARTDYRSAERSPLASKLASGKQAAKKVFNLMSKRPTICPDPWGSFLELSLKLNSMSDFGIDQREDFISKMGLLQDNEDLLNNYYPHHSQIAGYVTDYLITKDLRAFLGTVEHYIV